MTRHLAAGPLLDPQAFHAQLADHAAWLRTGRSMLAAADLLWPRLKREMDEQTAESAAVRGVIDAGGIPPGYEPWGKFLISPQRKIPEAFIEYLGIADAYLLLAGYAVENLLKAVRIKRLSVAQKPVAFGGSEDDVPRHHKYPEVARVELGELSVSEHELLTRLSLFVRWAGRYPVAPAQPPLSETNGRRFSSDDQPQVHAFCERLIDKYESLR